MTLTDEILAAIKVLEPPFSVTEIMKRTSSKLECRVGMLLRAMASRGELIFTQGAKYIPSNHPLAQAEREQPTTYFEGDCFDRIKQFKIEREVAKRDIEILDEYLAELMKARKRLKIQVSNRTNSALGKRFRVSTDFVSEV